MADEGEHSAQYRQMLMEMMQEIDGGRQPDRFALDKLREAQKSLVNDLNREGGAKARKKRKPDIPMASVDVGQLRFSILKEIWHFLYPYTQPEKRSRRAFEKEFCVGGMEGYKKFQDSLRYCVECVVGRECTLSEEQKKAFLDDVTKPEGWLDNIIMSLVVNVWDVLLLKIKEQGSGEIDILGQACFHEQKKATLEEWTKSVAACKSDSNVKYTNKIVKVGPLDVEVSTGGTRPSRLVPNMRSIHFLDPKQVIVGDAKGKGVQGDVVSCYVEGCPLIPPHTRLIAKKFIAGGVAKRRQDALQEMLMGAVNHKGVIGACGLTIEDPPRLLYDLYNGGDLRSFIDKIESVFGRKGKHTANTELTPQFISEKKIFLENRLGIAMALMETLAFLHGTGRYHCDLHEGNVLLHFEYVAGVASKVYVGICDFGMSRHKNQCGEKEYQMWAMPMVEKKAFMEKFPQMAPELVGPKPAKYSEQSDVYALGNMFETLLLAPCGWDGETKTTRSLFRDWSWREHDARLQEIIKAMKHVKPSNRLSCSHWVDRFVRAFGACNLVAGRNYFLRD